MKTLLLLLALISAAPIPQGTMVYCSKGVTLFPSLQDLRWDRNGHHLARPEPFLILSASLYTDAKGKVRQAYSTREGWFSEKTPIIVI